MDLLEYFKALDRLEQLYSYPSPDERVCREIEAIEKKVDEFERQKIISLIGSDWERTA